MYNNTLFKVNVQRHTVYSKFTAMHSLEQMYNNTLFTLNVQQHTV